MREIRPLTRLREELEHVKRSTRQPFYLLAASVGISETRLAKILSGQVIPRPDERKCLAALVCKTEPEVFGGATVEELEQRGLLEGHEVGEGNDD
jgi:hypothetical protein